MELLRGAESDHCAIAGASQATHAAPRYAGAIGCKPDHRPDLLEQSSAFCLGRASSPRRGVRPALCQAARTLLCSSGTVSVSLLPALDVLSVQDRRVDGDIKLDKGP